MNNQRVEATATRQRTSWEINFSDLGTRTAARTLVGVQGMAVVCAALWLDAEPNSRCTGEDRSARGCAPRVGASPFQR